MYFKLGPSYLQRVQNFSVEKVALGQVFLRPLRVSPVVIVPLKFHAHLHLYKET